MCRRCHRRIANVHDLNSKCLQLRKHFFNEGSFEGTPRPNRKRRLDSIVLKCSFRKEDTDQSRRKLAPSKKLKQKSFISPSFYLVDFNGVRINDAAINAIFSPQLGILHQNVKSSTPLIEEKENLPVIAVTIEKNDTAENTTPENRDSLVLVSALKKNSTPYDGARQTDGRKVTFQNSDSPQLNVSVYGTPMSSFCDDDEGATANNCDILVAVSPVRHLSQNSDRLTIDESQNCKIATLARSVKLGLNGIPRSLLSIWDWTQSKIRKRKTVTFQSPTSKRKRWDMSILRRRPISSQWVNMNVSSLVRNPLPAYMEKYNLTENDFHEC